MILIATREEKTYLGKLKQRYRRAGKKEKQLMLDEFTKTTKYTRKHAIHLLTGNYQYTKKPIKRSRKRRYDILDAIVLAKVSELLDWINAKRIKPQIGVAIDHLVAAGKLVCSPEQRKKLMKISPATIDRLLKTYKKRPVGKGRSYTKPGTLLKTQIPIRTFADWNENKVGFFEIDLCGHDGGLAKGDFSWTLNFVEVKVQWTEQVAVFNKAQIHVFAGIKTIRKRLPFPLLGAMIQTQDLNSLMINYTATVYKKRLPLPEEEQERKMIIRMLNRRMIQSSDSGLDMADIIHKSTWIS